jgi:hypothetical protein
VGGGGITKDGALVVSITPHREPVGRLQRRSQRLHHLIRPPPPLTCHVYVVGGADEDDAEVEGETVGVMEGDLDSEEVGLGPFGPTGTSVEDADMDLELDRLVLPDVEREGVPDPECEVVFDRECEGVALGEDDSEMDGAAEVEGVGVPDAETVVVVLGVDDKDAGDLEDVVEDPVVDSVDVLDTVAVALALGDNGMDALGDTVPVMEGVGLGKATLISQTYGPTKVARKSLSTCSAHSTTPHAIQRGSHRAFAPKVLKVKAAVMKTT